MVKDDVEQGKFCALLAYILIGIIWYFADDKMKKNQFAKFHVKQALVLLIAAVIINVVGSALPVIGWFIILPLGSIFIVILWLFGMVYSINGTKKELPFIGKFAKKFTF